MESESIPLIEAKWSNDGTTMDFAVTQEARSFLSSLHDTITPIAAVGPYRSGKSYLMGRLSEQPRAFATSSSSQACTRGIHMSTKFFGPNKIFFMDTEGLGAPGSTTEIDSRILAFAILFSAKIYFFGEKTIDSKLFESLQCAIGTAQWLKDASANKHFLKQNPQFVLLLKDVSLVLENAEGKKITPDEYYQLSLDTYCATNNSTLKTALSSLFSSQHCMTMSVPCTPENMATMTNLSQQFQDDFAAVRRNAMNATKPKMIDGTSFLNGPILLQIADSLCEALSKPGAPKLLSVWDAAVQQAAIERKFRLINVFQNKLNEKLSALRCAPLTTFVSLGTFSSSLQAILSQFSEMTKYNDAVMPNVFVQDLTDILQEITSVANEMDTAKLQNWKQELQDAKKYLEQDLHDQITYDLLQLVPSQDVKQIVEKILETCTALQNKSKALQAEVNEKTEYINMVETQINNGTLMSDGAFTNDEKEELERAKNDAQHWKQQYEETKSDLDDLMALNNTMCETTRAKINDMSIELHAARDVIKNNETCQTDLKKLQKEHDVLVKKYEDETRRESTKRKLDDLSKTNEISKLRQRIADYTQREQDVNKQLTETKRQLQEYRLKFMEEQCKLFPKFS